MFPTEQFAVLQIIKKVPEGRIPCVSFGSEMCLGGTEPYSLQSIQEGYILLLDLNTSKCRMCCTFNRKKNVRR